MSHADLSAIDFVRELRLRQWARRHYVSIEGRKSTWHPVVLDEMSRRDRELIEACAVMPIETITIPRQPLTDAPAAMPAYKENAPLQYQEEDLPWAGSAYVPLAPSGDWRFHTAEVDIPKPHFAAALASRSEIESYAELKSFR